MFMSVILSLTSKREKDLYTPLNEVYPVKEQRQILPCAMKSFSPVMSQWTLHRPPETKQEEESTRQCMSFEVCHLLQSASCPLL